MTTYQIEQPQSDTDDAVVRVDHATVKHLGHWTSAHRFQVHVRRGAVVVDLRSPRIAGGDTGADIDVAIDIDHGTLTLLLPTDATVDQWGIDWTGKGRVKDGEAPSVDGGRRVTITGRIDGGEIRVQRGGRAILSAMLSRAYLDELKLAHRDGVLPTVDDPTREN